MPPFDLSRAGARETARMLVTHEREKLIQAVNYFARNTRKFGKVKLYKLLYFLDFEHFKLTGTPMRIELRSSRNPFDDKAS